MMEPAARFAALGDPIRFAIVQTLGERGPQPTVGLRDQAAGVTRQGLTKHLHVLEQAGLIESHRAGRDRCWQLKRDEIAALRGMLDDVSAAWDARIERLRAFVEE